MFRLLLTYALVKGFLRGLRKPTMEDDITAFIHHMLRERNERLTEWMQFSALHGSFAMEYEWVADERAR